MRRLGLIDPEHSCARSVLCVFLLACSADAKMGAVTHGGASTVSSTANSDAQHSDAGDSSERESGEPDAARGMRVDGASCVNDEDCAGGHCNQGLCCAGGRCCKSDADCGAGDGAICSEPHACQGMRGTMACLRNRCRVQDGVDDDSACDAQVVADDCGFYRDLSCSGRMDQRAPECATSCEADADCDDNARCRDGACVAAEPNGGTCTSASDCASRHCAQGVCCEAGDCCRRDTDCPLSASSLARCTDLPHCQGRRAAASCVDAKCEVTMVEDDSGCGLHMLAQRCAMTDVYCTGAVSQSASRDCSNNCRWDADCRPEQYCDGFACVADRPDGSACDRASACQSGVCAGSPPRGRCARNESERCERAGDCDAPLECRDGRCQVPQ